MVSSSSADSHKRPRHARTESDEGFIREILEDVTASSGGSSKRYFAALLSPSSTVGRKSQAVSTDDECELDDSAIRPVSPSGERILHDERADGERNPATTRTNLAQMPRRHMLWKEYKYTADFHPLIHELRTLIRNRNVGCALCARYEWGPIVQTHKVKYCEHRAEAGEARRWLDMFRGYQAQGGGIGARCEHCRFPVALCWRTVYKEEMDAEYGNELEARENFHVWYSEARCRWVKVIQRFVASMMVVGGMRGGRGVGQTGVTALEEMGWNDWRGLEENGPQYMQKWLEEADEIEGLRCPRLLKLFWRLVDVRHKEQR